MKTPMQVLKRDGHAEPISFDKITNRLTALSADLNVDPILVSQKTIQSLYDHIATEKIDEVSAEIAASLTIEHDPDYGILAGRILVSNHEKKNRNTFREVVEKLYNTYDMHGVHTPVVSKELYEIVQEAGERLEAEIDYTRDYTYDFFAVKTLMRSYLLHQDEQVLERIQHMWMRVALGIHGRDLDRAIESYHAMSKKEFTHATPTLFHAGTPHSQYASCFLQAMKGDSISSIFETLGDCATISKWGGGIGLHVHNVRAKGSRIRGTNGKSNGLVPMLKVFNHTARYVDQGGGKRKGSFAIYLEPWHADIFDFLNLKKNRGEEEMIARDLFYGLWIPDLFMKRVELDAKWSLMCPDQAPGLADVHSEAFETLYEQYEREGRFIKQVDARKLWNAILEAQIETGTPYLLYKDTANRKSNQKNLGTIKSSNLCVAPETVILTKNGYQRIEDLKDQSVEVWNGHEWSETTVRQTSDRSELMRIDLSDDTFIECTPYHKFYCTESMTEAKDLKVGDTLRGWKLPESEKEILQTVVAVEKHGRQDRTFCFDEPKRHMGVFNGILTGNCTEIIEYSEKDECAVCNLASISLKAFVDPQAKVFDFEKLRKVVHIVTRNLNRVIDRNFYPTPETKKSNFRHRPIGIGVQGLADAFCLLRMPFESDEARDLNRKIFATIYYAALEQSVEEAKERAAWVAKVKAGELSPESVDGGPEVTTVELARETHQGAYESYFENGGCPASHGQLQYDLWGVSPEPMWDWSHLKEQIARHGLRNSLLVAPMPTASTAQILGNTEAFEPFTSNLLVRRTLAGGFPVVNAYLMRDLMERNLWTPEIRTKLIATQGNLGPISEIPEEIRNLYKTVWEIKQRCILDLAADRGVYIDQSQSMNLYVADPTISKLSSMHFYGWRLGLKTGCYYLRSQAASRAQAFTVDPRILSELRLSVPDSQTDSGAQTPVPKTETEEEGCVMCSA